MLNQPSRDATRDQDIFRELSDNFPDFAELMFEIGEVFQARSAGSTPRATVQLYERWLKTGSPAIEEALGQRGIFPMPGSDTLH
jgi:hypothetical protein